MSSIKPIIFSGPMVCALLEGRKTQTRRIVKPSRKFPAFNICRPDVMHDANLVWWHGSETEKVGVAQPCPYGKPGDLLYVRETSKATYNFDKIPCVRYEADQVWKPCYHGVPFASWCDMHHYRAGAGLQVPAIHQPRWASRITLEVADVRVHRLRDISEEDAEAEGIDFLRRIPDADETLSAKQLFEILWTSINGKDSWGANPYVWVMAFKVHQINVDKMISEKVAA